MRFEYSHFPLPGNVVEPRPIVEIVFDDDADRATYSALVDSGSLRTVVSRSAVDMDLNRPDGCLETLRFAGYVMHNVPFYPLSMTIKSPSPSWDDIPLPDVSVAVVDNELPFVLLGSAALAHLVFVLHEHDQVFHMKPREHFTQTRHYVDPLF